jgi:N-acetyl-gamma-glutamyl-phosphate reductase
MKRIGIVGVSGYGGSELLRLCLGHPGVELAYVSGEASAGQVLGRLVPGLTGPAASLEIQPFAPEKVAGIDVLFVSLPTGKSREPLARVSEDIRIVDVGGDHRFVEGWAYGLSEFPGQRECIRASTRIANPGCFAAPALLALAPLIKEGLVESEGIVIDAKSGVSGTGRGAVGDFGYVDTNEDLFAYGLESHPHVPEIEKALTQLGGKAATIAFTPHLVPMTRGILATCYARPKSAVRAEQLVAAAEACYKGEPFIRLTAVEKGRSAHTRWATGSNLCYLSYAVNPRTGLAVALGAVDNLGKGASAQALQNANLITGQPETAGLGGLPFRP